MPTASEELVAKLWSGKNPFAGFPKKLYMPDMQGWNSNHRLLVDSIKMARPRVVAEIGVWKGGSCIHMAKGIRDLGLDAAVIAIDTWLGSSEHWMQEDGLELSYTFGYPNLYYVFAANVVREGVAEQVVPLPLDSANAAVLLRRLNLSIDMIHIDGAHDYGGVRSDLERWWPLLKPGAVVIMDDYDATGAVWPDVRKAIDDFVASANVSDFVADPYKARFIKR
jgi:predicted O-methyltransferase YrrM